MDLDGKALPEVISWASGPDQQIRDLICVGMGADRYYHRPMVTQGWVKAKRPGVVSWPLTLQAVVQDEMAWAVVAEYAGNYFVLESGGTRQGYSEEALKLIALRAQRWNVTQVVVEANFGDGMFSALLQPVLKVHPCGIEEIRVNIQKERRICDTLGPVSSSTASSSTDVIRKDYQDAERTLIRATSDH